VTIIRPFRALRPNPEVACKVACVPYDVVNDAEVYEYIRENPLSFLRITRPEAELSLEDRTRPELVFERARQNLKEFIDKDFLFSEPEPSVYIYRLSSDTHHQTGVVACCSLDEYEKGMIRKHENTRPDKVEDRTGHLLTLRAQTGLILLTYRGTDRIKQLTDEATKQEPLYNFDGTDCVQQTVWRATATEDWIEAFSQVPGLYIADGHHRIESADLARKTLAKENPDRNGNSDHNFVMAGIFPAEDLRILAYNRAVRDLGGLTAVEFLDRLRESFVVSDAEHKEPKTHGEICMYLAGRWYRLFFNVQHLHEPDPIERLDVSILQDYILGPVLSISDPRTDDRIMFVGGGRGTSELEHLVDTGDAVAAFSLFPTSMDDLLTVSDANEIMPPKSTWFEPKLKDGLLVHQI